MKIGLVYFSNTDVTATLVAAACEEIKNSDEEYFCHRITGSEIIEGRYVKESVMHQLHDCDAIIFGSPTYMGGVAAQFKAFADATSDLWEQQQWAGKIAAGITSGSSLNGDQGVTLQYLATLASQHGMIWVGVDAPFSDAEKSINRLGCQLGVVAHSSHGKVHEFDLATARYLAKRVVGIVGKLNN